MSEYTKMLEEINGKFYTILEIQKAWASVPGKLQEIDTTLKEIDSDLKGIIKTLGCDSQDLELAA